MDDTNHGMEAKGDSADLQGSMTEGPGLPPELAEKIPADIRQQVTTIFASAQQSSISPLIQKITPEHIAKAMDMAREQAGHELEYAKGSRFCQMLIYGSALAVFVFLVVFLADNPTILAPVLAALLGFAGGYGVGGRSRGS